MSRRFPKILSLRDKEGPKDSHRSQRHGLHPFRTVTQGRKGVDMDRRQARIVVVLLERDGLPAETWDSRRGLR